MTYPTYGYTDFEKVRFNWNQYRPSRSSIRV